MEIRNGSKLNNFNKVSLNRKKESGSAKINTRDSFKHSAATEETKDLKKAAEVLLRRNLKGGPEKIWSVEQSGKMTLSSRGDLFASRGQYKRFTRISPLTGQDLWSVGLDSSIYEKPVEGPDGSIFAVTSKGLLMSLDPATGKKRWEFQGEKSSNHSPSFDDKGDIYFHSGKKIYVFDGKTHDKKKEFEVDKDTMGAAVVSGDGRVYLADRWGEIHCHDSKDGEMKWKFNCQGLLQSSPVIGPNGDLYAGTNNSKFIAVDGKTGKEKWSIRTNHKMTYPAKVDEDGTIYAGCADHNLYALDSTTGRAKWTFDCNAEIKQPPVTGPGDNVYFVSEKNEVFCLDKKTGEKKWKFKTEGFVTDSPSVDEKGNIYFPEGDQIHAFSDKATMKAVEKKKMEEKGLDPDQQPEINESKTFVEIGGVKLEKRGK